MEEDLESRVDSLVSSSRLKKETLLETFERLFPYYLSIGMTSEEYWEGSPSLVKFYRKASELRNKRKNEELWLQGLYISNALNVSFANFGKALSKKTGSVEKYIERPIPISRLEIREEEERKEKEKMIKIMAYVERKIKSNKKENKEIQGDN